MKSITVKRNPSAKTSKTASSKAAKRSSPQNGKNTSAPVSKKSPSKPGKKSGNGTLPLPAITKVAWPLNKKPGWPDRSVWAMIGKDPQMRDATNLEYSVIPSSVYYTRDPQNPSMVVLTIGASNTTDQDISLLGFQIKLPVSNDPKDKNAITTDPTSVIAISMQPLAWDFQRVDDGVYRAEPIPPVTGLKARESVTFQLQNLAINETDGTAILTILENPGDGTLPTTDKQVVKIKSNLEVRSFDANPVQVVSGDPSILSWTTANAARVTLIPGDFPDIKPNDSVTVRPGSSTTYTLTAYGEGPNISVQRTVQISSPEIRSFTASANKVNAGDSVTLSWDVLYASDISISPGGHTSLPASGSLPVKILTDSTYILTANNKGNEYVNKPLSIAINPVAIDSFTADPSYGARAGQPIKLSWEMRSAISATIQFGTINKIDPASLVNGSLDVIPNTGVAYSLIAQNSLGNEMRSIELFPMPLGWHQFTSSAPFRFPDPPLVLTFNNYMWAMNSNMMNFIYKSFDGATWIPVLSTLPWTARSFSAGVVFNNKMWMMGGKTPQGSNVNDVWSSSDGVRWDMIKGNATWSPRNSFGCFVIPGINKMFVIGGLDDSGNRLSDVWSSTDGANWSKETDRAFEGRYGFAVVAFNGKAWLMGGQTSSVTNEIWSSSDGVSWYIQTGGMRPPARLYPCAAALKEGIFLSGGLDASGKGIADMYKMTTAGSWSTTIGPPWGSQNILYTGYTEYQNALWFVGGAVGTNISQSPRANPNVWAYAP